MGKRPDYATTVYCNLIRQTYKDVPILIGGIEASLRPAGALRLLVGHHEALHFTGQLRPTCSCTAWGKRPSWRWPTP
ncbi:MAG: hypothetical protein ACLU9S_05980 [Oscillospiraceae bacterium]